MPPVVYTIASIAALVAAVSVLAYWMASRKRIAA